MSLLSSSASSSSSSSTPLPNISNSRPRKRKWSRQQLLRNLEILGTLSAPLPPTLPPSPPASRASSPAPSQKRKSDFLSDTDAFKRPRTSSFSDRPSHQHRDLPQQQPPPVHQQTNHLPLPPPPRPSLPPPILSARSEPEDGEVHEDPILPSRGLPPAVAAHPSAPVVPSQVPVRRPKRGRGSYPHYDSLQEKYHNQGRMLKYSGDARFWSTYPSTHREYRPLLDPPPPSSPYHKYGGLIARLELVDALVCFTYSIWNKEYCRRSCNRETWRTIEGFLVWCKQKWQAEDGINDAEKAFLGLIWMIEAFIHTRKLTYNVRHHLDGEMDKYHNECKKLILDACLASEQDPIQSLNGALLAPKTQATPPMLPSPASIAPANSANSTPTTRDSGTPNTSVNPNGRGASVASTSTARPIQYPPGTPSVPATMLPKNETGLPFPPNAMAAMAAVTLPIGPNLIQELKDHTAAVNAAAWCMTTAQASLNLPIVARHFPITFARMIYTSLSPTEEHEPDFEDEEGELFWPGQSVTGEGLGWVCLMGKAMIKEFGKAYGYIGVDGVVPKPKPEDLPEEGSLQPPQPGMMQNSNPQGQTQRPGFTPQGHTPSSSSSSATPSGPSAMQHSQRPAFSQQGQASSSSHQRSGFTPQHGQQSTSMGRPGSQSGSSQQRSNYTPQNHHPPSLPPPPLPR